MSMEDLEVALSTRTAAWLAALMGAGDLYPTHYRLLSVLREINTSPSVLAHLTGIQVSRVRTRLRELRDRGLVTVTEELSDKTQIWGLAEVLAKDGVQTYPTEATVKERRSRHLGGTTEYSEDVRKLWTGPDGVVRPRNPVTVDRIDVNTLKQYEAKANK